MPTDFSSLDKLVEFGLGVGIATQMMNTMNHTIAQTAVPGVGINPGVAPQPQVQNQNSPAAAQPAGFYIVDGDHLAGPLSDSELDQLVKKRVVEAGTLCWRPGLEAWKMAEDIPEVNKLLLLNS